MQLVEIKKLDLVTNSAVIASGVMKDHKPVIQLIRKYKSDLEEFGRVEFEMRPFQTDGGMQKQEIALLNEQQTTLLITYMRNNEVVREFKKRLVAEFFTMRSALAKKKMGQVPCASRNREERADPRLPDSGTNSLHHRATARQHGIHQHGVGLRTTQRSAARHVRA